MRQPDVYTIDELRKWPNEKLICVGTEYYWAPSRPIAHNAWSCLWRWKLAWRVLTGKADVVSWYE